MNTIRTISNISYNSPDHLRHVLTSLAKRGVIDWAYWIFHKADCDELKDHAHLVLKPAKRIDTAQLKSLFDELDPQNPHRPLSVTSKWNPCNSLDDWLLYAVHDTKYLQSKGQERNFHYTFDDIEATDLDALRSDWNSIDRRKFDRLNALYNAVQQSVPFHTLIMTGVIPIAQSVPFERLYNSLYEDKVKRDQESKEEREDRVRRGGRIESHDSIATASDSKNFVKSSDFVPADDILF